MDRRRFIATTLTGLASVSVGRRAFAAQAVVAPAAATLPTRTLGKAGPKVTVVGARPGS